MDHERNKFYKKFFKKTHKWEGNYEEEKNIYRSWGVVMKIAYFIFLNITQITNYITHNRMRCVTIYRFINAL